MTMPKKIMLLGTVLLAAFAAAAFVVEPGHTPSIAGDTSIVGSSTSPDGSKTHIQAGRAIADPLSLRVLHSYTTHDIKNEYVPSTARGIYLVMDVTATNRSEHAVALDSGQIRLTLGGRRYKVSADALTALDLTGHTTFSASSLLPSASVSGWVAFDVPAGALAERPQLCLDERGAGGIPVC